MTEIEERNEQWMAEEVRKWRKEQFRKLGFQPTNATMLAESHADLSLARKLVEKDCPLKTVLEIVL